MSRRQAVVGLSLGLPAAVMFAQPACAGESKGDPNLVDVGWKACPQQGWTPPSGPSLTLSAARSGRYFGTAVKDSFLKPGGYRDLILHEASALVCIYTMKWETLEPEPGQFRFKLADPYVEAADKYKKRMRGHTLIWYQALPKWAADAVDKDPRGTMERHIASVVERYQGQVASWDVVNEAVDPGDGRDDGLRNNIFLAGLGPEYIRMAFEMAHAADPRAQLVYNCNGNAYRDAKSRAHFEADLKVIESLVKSGAPVHAIGLQGHLNAARNDEFDEKLLSRFFGRVRDLGLDAIVTELDASDKKLPADFEVRDGAVSAAYRQFLDVVLAQSNVEGVLTWGMSDRDSGHNRWPREDGYLVRGLPYDVCLANKPLRQTMIDAFDRAVPFRSART
jgi:endo-1,4-beta-xylanase